MCWRDTLQIYNSYLSRFEKNSTRHCITFRTKQFSFLFFFIAITNTANFTQNSGPTTLLVLLLKEKQNAAEAIRQAEKKGQSENGSDCVTRASMEIQHEILGLSEKK